MDANWGLIMLICVSVIPITYTIYDFIKKENASKLQIKEEKERSLKLEKLLEKSNRILNETDRLILAQTEVLKRSETIINVQNETLNNLTGGSGVPKLRVYIRKGGGINAYLDNDTKYPIRNVELYYDCFIDDYDISDGNGGSISRPLKGLERFNKLEKVGDLQKKSSKEVFDSFSQEDIKKFLYIFTVKWENGSYVCGFKYDATNKKNPILEANVTIYTKGLNLKDVFKVNDVVGKVIEQKNIKWNDYSHHPNGLCPRRLFYTCFVSFYGDSDRESKPV